MLGKITYDIPQPEREVELSENRKFIQEFMRDKTHKSVSVDYGERKVDADKFSASIRKAAVRENADTKIVQCGSIVYIEKNNFEKEEVVIPKSVKEKKSQPEKVIDIPKVLVLRTAGWSQAKIADEMRCSQGRISQIISENKK